MKETDTVTGADEEQGISMPEFPGQIVAQPGGPAYEIREAIIAEKRDEYKMLVNLAKESSQGYSKNLVMLSAGAFAISATLVNQVIRNPVAETVFLLQVAWVLFGITLVAALLSSLCSFHAMNEAIKIVLKEVRALMDDADPTVDGKNWWNIAVKSLNWLSWMLFSFGVCALIAFSVLNKPI